MMGRCIARISFTYRTLESKKVANLQGRTLKNVLETICERNYDLYYFATEIGPTNLAYSSGDRISSMLSKIHRDLRT